MSVEKTRAAIKSDAPEMFDLMEMLKNDFGGKVLYVKTATLEAGKDPGAGVKPAAFLPDSTWPYAVGKPFSKKK